MDCFVEAKSFASVCEFSSGTLFFPAVHDIRGSLSKKRPRDPLMLQRIQIGRSVIEMARNNMADVRKAKEQVNELLDTNRPQLAPDGINDIALREKWKHNLDGPDAFAAALRLRNKMAEKFK
ncbi:hypothetical protein ABVF61_07280 [Roseibium sp. HPY-6]|uniref:hypothetical protein n=1 Tax=Roseibium sp. HPY-6 TaxID=3229852 RepID=UPI00338D8A86